MLWKKKCQRTRESFLVIIFLGGIRNYFVRVRVELMSSIVDKIIPIIYQDGFVLLRQKVTRN